MMNFPGAEASISIQSTMGRFFEAISLWVCDNICVVILVSLGCFVPKVIKLTIFSGVRNELRTTNE